MKVEKLPVREQLDMFMRKMCEAQTEEEFSNAFCKVLDRTLECGRRKAAEINLDLEYTPFKSALDTMKGIVQEQTMEHVGETLVSCLKKLFEVAGSFHAGVDGMLYILSITKTDSKDKMFKSLMEYTSKLNKSYCEARAAIFRCDDLEEYAEKASVEDRRLIVGYARDILNANEPKCKVNLDERVVLKEEVATEQLDGSINNLFAVEERMSATIKYCQSLLSRIYENELWAEYALAVFWSIAKVFTGAITDLRPIIRKYQRDSIY